MIKMRYVSSMLDGINSRMTPEELRSILEAHGISQMDLSRRVGVAGQTVRRWVRHDGEVPGCIAVLMRLIDARPELIGLIGFKRRN